MYVEVVYLPISSVSYRLQNLLGIRCVLKNGHGLTYLMKCTQIFEVNVKAAALLVKEAHPHLVASG